MDHCLASTHCAELNDPGDLSGPVLGDGGSARFEDDVVVLNSIWKGGWLGRCVTSCDPMKSDVDG